MPSVSWRRGAFVLSAFVLVAALQAWPLPLALSTRLTGPPGGDSGVYVWNLWVFRHQLLVERSNPMRTMEILPLDGPTDLSLHNYTVFSDLMALPLLSRLDVVTAFNVVYLLNVALAGFGLYLLARRLTGRTSESVIAGAVFACSPFLVARSTAHFSLVAAAPLPFFLLFLLRAWDGRRVGDAMLVGVSVAWAAYCDPYYAIYCAMLGLAVVASRITSLQSQWRPAIEYRTASRVVDVALLGLLAIIVGVAVIGGGEVALGPLRISMRSLYTPVLLLTALVLLRVLLTVRFAWTLQPMPPARWMLGAGLAAVGTAALLLSPQLIALAHRQAEGRMVSAPILWRSSPPGVDLVSLLAPNPHHPLAPDALVAWMTARPNALVDQVASLSWVGAALVIVAWRRTALRLPAFWVAVTLAFALLSLGPFIQIAGLNTHVPTPWALLRYVPVIGAARMPSRLAVVTTLGFCVLVALALTALATHFATRRRLVLWGAAVALSLELLPIPRTLFSGEIPTSYESVRADPRPIRVLELPTGVRDGLSSLGNYSASAQFHQTYHEKGIIGGYLSRVSQPDKEFHLQLPVFSTLMKLSARDAVAAKELDAARAGAADFLDRAAIAYVVFHTERISPELRAFATDAFRLQHVASDRGREVYVPGKEP